MDYTLLSVVAYAFITFAIAVEAYYRGHNFFWAFIMTIFITPLLGAIMFAHYKPEEWKDEETGKEKAKP